MLYFAIDSLIMEESYRLVKSIWEVYIEIDVIFSKIFAYYVYQINEAIL